MDKAWVGVERRIRVIARPSEEIRIWIDGVKDRAPGTHDNVAWLLRDMRVMAVMMALNGLRGRTRHDGEAKRRKRDRARSEETEYAANHERASLAGLISNMGPNDWFRQGQSACVTAS
jgi:hypothetical protein